MLRVSCTKRAEKAGGETGSDQNGFKLPCALLSHREGLAAGPAEAPREVISIHIMYVRVCGLTPSTTQSQRMCQPC